jgi:hypothetical protein
MIVPTKIMNPHVIKDLFNPGIPATPTLYPLVLLLVEFVLYQGLYPKREE